MAAAKSTTITKWSCLICTYENQATSKLCEMCGTRQPGSTSGSDQDDNGWKCVLCCVCGAPSPLTNDLSGKQICASCTTINFANAHTCSVCGQALSHKIIQMDDNGEYQQIQIDPNKSNQINNNNNDNLPQYANPLGGNDMNAKNGYYNGYQPQSIQNNHYQQPQPQIPQYQQPSYYQQPPMPPQQIMNNGGNNSFFGGMGGWFGGGGNDMNIDQNFGHSKHHQNKKHKSKKKSSKNKHNNSNGSDIKFKDVTEIFKNDANDKERLKKEEEDVKILSEWYSHIYLTKKSKYNEDKIADIINKMIKFIPKEHWDEVEKNKNNDDDQKTDLTLCQVCYCKFDDDEGKLIVMEEYCDHAMVCKSCFKQHLKIKIKDDDITPWIACCAPDCKAPICCSLLLKYLDTKNLYKFAEGFIRKHLARNSNWIRCGTKNCNFGWMILDKNTTKQHKLKCGKCGKRQTVCKDPIKSDKGFNELIKSGVLRLCPKCSLPTMKDKGMCNVMNCGKCGIYWNWRTYETGTSSSQLKNRARNNGTLWEPGELAYQQQLQRTNLPEFKRLLEANGIKYDPNYVRGTR